MKPAQWKIKHWLRFVYALCAGFHQRANHITAEMLRSSAGALDDTPAIIRIDYNARQTIRLAVHKADATVGFCQRQFTIRT